MRFADILNSFLSDLRNQRLRTALTIMGITWGTVAVVVLLAFGGGLEKQQERNMAGMGDGIVVVFPGTTTKPYAGFNAGRRIRLREEDAHLLKAQIDGIADISPEYRSSQMPTRVGTSITTPVVTGVYPIYGDMRNIFPQAGGRFLNELDMAGRRRVAFLGDEIKELLFGDADAIGRDVMIGSTPFTVVGVMQPKTQNSSYHARDKDRVFVPSTTYQAMFGHLYVGNLIYRPADPAEAPAIRDQVYQVMSQRYRFDPSDRSAINLWDTTEMSKFLGYFFLGFKIFLGVVGSFTLIVGGIGVANIMYVVVKERTREIGVKRSVGARKRDIMVQFFLEAFLIVAIGAALGFALSYGLVTLVGMMPIEEYVGAPIISGAVALATAAILAFTAFTAGFFPARKAANLDPVECLRY